MSLLFELFKYINYDDIMFIQEKVYAMSKIFTNIQFIQ